MDGNNYKVEDVKTIAKSIIRDFGGTGWEYLAKQFPVIFDDKLPAMDKFNLDQHETFSFANQYYVGFSESRALKQIQDYYSDNNLELSYGELARNIRNVLIHEYGHILLEHVFEKPKKTELDAQAQVITAEIETNRGINKGDRAKYFDEVIISDDKPDFETVKPFITHEAVYNAVKRLWQQRDNKKEEPKDDQCSNKGGGGDEKQDEQNKGQQSQGVENNTPSNPQTEQENSEQGQDSGQQEAQEQEKKPDHVGTMVQAMRDAASDDNAPQRDLLTELGLEPSKDFKEAKDIKGKLVSIQKLVRNDKIKKALSKIKGELAGELSKEKVGTYSRPSRKAGEDGLMRRGTKRGATKRPSVLIALDESGSMDTTAVQTAATAIKIMARTIGRNRTDVKICSFANYINRTATLKDYERVVDRYNPRGGTNFGSVVDLAENSGCDVVICIGDGLDTLSTTPFNGKLKKWIDVLITRADNCSRIEMYEYTDLDRETGRRETYWLGDNKDIIEGYALDM